MVGPVLIFTLFSYQLHAPPTVVQNAVDNYYSVLDINYHVSMWGRERLNLYEFKFSSINVRSWFNFYLIFMSITCTSNCCSKCRWQILVCARYHESMWGRERLNLYEFKFSSINGRSWFNFYLIFISITCTSNCCSKFRWQIVVCARYQLSCKYARQRGVESLWV